MRENIQNRVEKDPSREKVARIRELIRRLRERVPSKDNVDSYLEEGLSELVSITEEVIDIFEVSDLNSQKYKRDTEDGLFKELQMPSIEFLLAELTEKYGRTIAGCTPEVVHHMRELDTENLPHVSSKFLINKFIFNTIRPRMAEWIGSQATDRLLKSGAMNTWLQLLFYRNPIADEKSSFFTLRKKNIISFSIDDGAETRQSFALHRERLNVAGPHVSVAYMPPGYEQPFHTQKRLPERNLLIQGRQELHWIDGDGNTKIQSGNRGDIFFVPPFVEHTIRNSGDGIGINLMVKPFFERRIFNEAQKPSEFHSIQQPQIVSGKKVKYEWGNIISHLLTSVDDFDYELEIIDLLSGNQISLGTTSGLMPYEQELIVSFAPCTLSVERDSSRPFTLESGGILYAGTNESYRIANKEGDMATFVRIRLLNSRGTLSPRNKEI